MPFPTPNDPIGDPPALAGRLSKFDLCGGSRELEKTAPGQLGSFGPPHPGPLPKEREEQRAREGDSERTVAIGAICLTSSPRGED